jgi:hypothetical protein
MIILTHLHIPMQKLEVISSRRRDKTGEKPVLKNGPDCSPHLFGGWYPSDRTPGDVKYYPSLSSRKMVSGYKRPAFRARDK